MMMDRETVCAWMLIFVIFANLFFMVLAACARNAPLYLTATFNSLFWAGVFWFRPYEKKVGYHEKTAP